MEDATHDLRVRQAIRIRESCKAGAEGCVSIVTRLLADEVAPLTVRQRKTLIDAAVTLGRYGIGCARCKFEIRNMPKEVLATYFDRYGPVPPSCHYCKDTGIGSDGLCCLACPEVSA